MVYFSGLKYPLRANDIKKANDIKSTCTEMARQTGMLTEADSVLLCTSVVACSARLILAAVAWTGVSLAAQMTM